MVLQVFQMVTYDKKKRNSLAVFLPLLKLILISRTQNTVIRVFKCVVYKKVMDFEVTMNSSGGYCVALERLQILISLHFVNDTSTVKAFIIIMDSRVSREQLEILLDHLSRHLGMAKGYGLGGRSKETTERLWNELAAKLNAVGNGATKTGVQWKRYWIDLKHKAKSRAAMLRREHSATGGGPSQHKPLSDTFQKVLAIIGEEAACGDTQYRVPAFDAEETSSLSVRRQLFPHTATITSSPTQGLSPRPSVSGANRELNSPSTHGHTMIVLEYPDESEPAAENNRLPETCPTANVQADTPETRPRVSPIRNRRRAANLRSTTDNSWVVDLERRRIAAEEKLAEAAMMMAESAKINAQAAMIQAEASQTQANALLNLANLLK